MEKRYWELREMCEQAFNKWLADRQEPSFHAYKEALRVYQDFCMDMLEQLMDENANVLKNLKNWS